MFEHDTEIEKALAFSRLDADNWLSPCANYPFELENKTWPTAEHYYQANIVARSNIAEAIANAEDGKTAYKMGSPWYRRKRKDWKTVRRVLMTRGLYTATMTHPELKAALLATGDQGILETSLYDPYWGLARDQRGENILGKIWMDIREKIRTDEAVVEEPSDSASGDATNG